MRLRLLAAFPLVILGGLFIILSGEGRLNSFIRAGNCLFDWAKWICPILKDD